MKASQLVRRVVTLVLVIYFASRIIASYLKLERGDIGTLFNRIVSDTVQYPETTMCVYLSESDRIIHLDEFPTELRKTHLINKYYYYQEQNGQVY